MTSLFKSISLYSIISLYQALLVFLTIMYLSHNMQVDIFGEYNLYLSIIPFLFNIMYLGTTGAVNVFYHKVTLQKFKFYLGNIIYILPLSLLVGLFLYYFLGENISSYFELNKDILLLIVFLVLFQILPQVLFVYFQTTQSPKLYMVYNGIYLSLNFILTIIIYSYTSSLFNIFLVLLFSSLIFSFIAIFYFLKKNMIYIKFKQEIFQEILTYSTPLVIHSLGIALLFMSDRFFISYFKGNTEVAYYSVALQLSMVALIFINSFSYAWNAYLFKFLKQNNNQVTDELKKRMHKIIIGFLLLPFLFFYIQKFVLVIFFDEQYYIASQYIFLITIGYSILGIWKVYNPFLFYLKKTVLISLTTLIALISNLILNYFFIQYYGTVGIAYATIISILFLSLINLYLANKLYEMY